ncbi:MAG: Maf family protein, partial [Sphingomicrobium sp.]
MSLILASTSAIRRAMLDQAGVTYGVAAPDVDEGPFQAAYVGRDAELALALAEAKALGVSMADNKDWVIGGDSVVAVDGRRFSKPHSRENAAEHLRFFSG